jgi:hypothetical protein
MKTSTADYLRIVALNIINYKSFPLQLRGEEPEKKVNGKQQQQLSSSSGRLDVAFLGEDLFDKGVDIPYGC